MIVLGLFHGLVLLPVLLSLLSPAPYRSRKTPNRVEKATEVADTSVLFSRPRETRGCSINTIVNE